MNTEFIISRDCYVPLCGLNFMEFELVLKYKNIPLVGDIIVSSSGVECEVTCWSHGESNTLATEHYIIKARLCENGIMNVFIPKSNLIKDAIWTLKQELYKTI